MIGKFLIASQLRRTATALILSQGTLASGCHGETMYRVAKN